MSPSSAAPWLTVATVVKDDLDGFRRTQESIACQELDGVEWLVIDGSADPTALREALANGPECTYAWRPPHGVYAAMNDALQTATGTYVLFLNAGDELAAPEAITQVRELVEKFQPTWLFGQVAFVDPAGARVLPPPLDYPAEKAAAFSRGRFPPHQGTVARVEELRRLGGFDEQYHVAADYALMLQLASAADPVQTDAVLATFYTGGLSSTAWQKSLREFHRARVEHLDLTGRQRLRESTNTARQWLEMGIARAVRR